MSTDFKDVSEKGDKSVLLQILDRGEDGARPGDLATCWVHYRIFKERKNGGVKVLSSTKAEPEEVGFAWRGGPTVQYRAGLAVESYHEYSVRKLELVTCENQVAYPKRFVLGEAEVPECVENAARYLSVGGKACLQLESGAMLVGRPEGKVNVEVELVSWDEPCRSASVRAVREELSVAEKFLSKADGARGAVDAFSKLNATTDPATSLCADVSEVVRKASLLAARRFQRAQEWLASLAAGVPCAEELRVRALAGLAKALLLHQRSRGAEASIAEEEASRRTLLRYCKRDDLLLRSDPAKAIRTEALAMAEAALQLQPTDVQAQAAAVLAYAELGDFGRAKEQIGKALEDNPRDVRIRSELARITVREKEEALKCNAAKLLDARQKLDDLVKKSDVAKVKQAMDEIADLADENKVSWEACRASEVGRSVGSIQRKPPKGDKELAKAAQELIGKLRHIADRRCRQMI